MNCEVLQPNFVWNGQLVSGVTDTLSMGKLTFRLNETSNLKIWTSNPNDGLDGRVENDTTQLNGLMTGLSGVYTIEGEHPDFLTFQEAIEALEERGVAGEVTFKVRNGIYQEQLTLKEIIGADSLQTITFESESGDSSKVVLNEIFNNNNHYIMKLDGADWITFKGMT